MLDTLRYVWTHRDALSRIAHGLHDKRSRPLVRAIRNLPVEEQRRAAIQLLEDAVIEFDFDGVHWRTDCGDEISESVYTSGGYEGPEIAAVLEHLPAGGTIIDLGANIGTTAIPFALAGYHVIAVEPVPATYEMLTYNIDRNGLGSKVECVNAAIIDSPGPVKMWTGFGSGQGEVAVDGHEPGMTRHGDKGRLVVVDGVRLDDVAPAEVTLVWADIQGNETSAIRTGTRLWAEGVPLYLEVDPERLDLHGGLDSFLTEVEANFTTFRTRDDLLNRAGAPHPITEFRAWVHSIPRDRYEDAFLAHD